MSKPNGGCVRPLHFPVSCRNLNRRSWLSSRPNFAEPCLLRRLQSDVSIEASEYQPSACLWARWLRRRSLRPLWLLFLVTMSVTFVDSRAWAATETLESTDLRVEVRTNPYSFCVTGKVTAERLVCEDSVSLPWVRSCTPSPRLAM